MKDSRVPASHLSAQDRNNQRNSSNPANGPAAADRNRKVGESVERGRQARESALRSVKPIQPATNAIPAIANRPPAKSFPAFKGGEKGKTNG